MLPVALHDRHGLRSRQGLFQNYRIAQQQIELGEHELTQRHFLALGEILDEAPGGRMMRRGFALAVE